MDKKLLAIFVVSIITLATILFYFSISQTSIQSSPENLEECKTFHYSKENAINLVFFSDEETTKKYSEFLFQVEPFTEKDFNIYFIDSYKPECELYKDIALFCHSKDLIKKSTSCPNDFIIVPEKKSYEIRSSSYMNILSINTEHPLSVLAHEFGHAFANLAEEYVPAKIPSKSKNCVSSCEEFDDKFAECFEGCSESNYFRSIDSGIMRSLSANRYGAFDENLISELIKKSTSITGRAISNPIDCANEKYILLEGNYDSEKNNIEIIKKTIEQGCAGTNGNGNFNFTLIDSENSEISSRAFNPELIFTDAPENETIDGEIFKNEGEFYLKLPIISSADKLEILHNNKITEVTLKDVGATICLK